MVDWSWIISQITFWSPIINSRSEYGDNQDQGDEEDHLASTEMQRVPSLVEEKYLGAVIWVRRPTESALNILVISSSQFHVCIGLLVVMVFRSRDWVWLVRLGFGLGFVQVSTLGADHRMVGRCLGRVLGCGLVQVLGCVLHMLIGFYLGRMLG